MRFFSCTQGMAVVQRWSFGPISLHILHLLQVHHLKTHLRTNHNNDASGGGSGEDNAQTASGGGRRLPPHRNPRIPIRRTPKPQQMHQPPGVVHPDSLPHPHPHLTGPPHPHGVVGPTAGIGGAGVYSSQPVSPPVAHSGTVPVPSAPTHTTQIPASGGVNHPAAMSGFFHSYNHHIYNSGVMQPYPALIDMNPVNHIPMH